VARGYHGGAWRSIALAPGAETYSYAHVPSLLLASGKGHQSNARLGCFRCTPQVQGNRQHRTSCRKFHSAEFPAQWCGTKKGLLSVLLWHKQFAMIAR
jgi:hypothetical protein